MAKFGPKKRKMKYILLSVFVLLLIGLGIMCVCCPEYFHLLFGYKVAHTEVASGNVIPLSDDAADLLYMPKKVSSSDVAAALENNLNANFQYSFQAEAAYVVDGNGNVLYAQKEHTKLYPASTTKLMTAYLALTKTEDLDALITVDELTGCYEWGSLLLYLEQGDQITMRDLLYALLLCSYNDSATAIAMEIGGSLEGFATLMNEQLQVIGAEESHFVTPHGLHDDEHYTSAHDLNLILQMAYGMDSLREILTMEKATIQIIRDGEPIVYDIQNSSFFVREAYQVPTMEYMGGKTGYTGKAGSCLASVFEYEGTTYYSTIMKAEDASYMTTILFDYYFAPEELAPFSATVPLMRD